MAKVSLQSQISAIELVINGQAQQMSGARKSLFQDHVRAAVDTLRWLKRHEADIRAFVEQKRGDAA